MDEAGEQISPTEQAYGPSEENGIWDVSQSGAHAFVSENAYTVDSAWHRFGGTSLPLYAPYSYPAPNPISSSATYTSQSYRDSHQYMQHQIPLGNGDGSSTQGNWIMVPRFHSNSQLPFSTLQPHVTQSLDVTNASGSFDYVRHNLRGETTRSCD
jgi:hypothetical protein